MEITRVKIADLKPHPQNYNTHPEAQLVELEKSLESFDQFKNIVVCQGVILAGHGLVMAAKRKGLTELDAVVMDGLTDEQQKALLIADNALPFLAIPDSTLLQGLLDDLGDYEIPGVNDDWMESFDFPETDPEYDAGHTEEKLSLVDRFIAPPFSVFDTKQGYWQDRKRMWREKGVQGGAGREEELCLAQSINHYDYRESYTGTSIFDPVLAEIMYTWFCPTGGQIIDPFAGGSERGIVASMLGFSYWGCDLSQKQVVANLQQGQKVCTTLPTWICGDSLVKMGEAPEADFILTCPPYGDLEKYSDDPSDLSNMNYNDFINTYQKIIKISCDKLKEDRLACFVVGEFRDKQGMYTDFINDTVKAFSGCSLSLYNSGVLLENGLNTAAMRADKLFNASRKFTKVHQNVLVFIKGDAKKATEKIKSQC